MLKKTTILALVGNSDINIADNRLSNNINSVDIKISELTKNKIIIYDDIESKINSELTLDSEVLNLRLKINKIIATTINNYRNKKYNKNI